jgi:hypothetical protein
MSHIPHTTQAQTPHRVHKRHARHAPARLLTKNAYHPHLTSSDRLGNERFRVMKGKLCMHLPPAIQTETFTLREPFARGLLGVKGFRRRLWAGTV